MAWAAIHSDFVGFSHATRTHAHASVRVIADFVLAHASGFYV